MKFCAYELCVRVVQMIQVKTCSKVRCSFQIVDSQCKQSQAMLRTFSFDDEVFSTAIPKVGCARGWYLWQSF